MQCRASACTRRQDENPDTVADFGHHPLLETGDSNENTTIMLEVVPRSDPIDIPLRDQSETYPSEPQPEATPPTWRGRLSNAWPLVPVDNYEMPRSPIDDGYQGRKNTNLRVQMHVPRGRDR